MAQWSSDETWNNGEARTIRREGPDPHDARFVAKQLDDRGHFKILGDGIAEFTGKGRLYVFKKNEKAALDKKTEHLWNPNLEISCDIKIDRIVSSDEEKAFVNVGGCTNHFAGNAAKGGDNRNSNGRNYSIRAYFNTDKVVYYKETIHQVYDPEEPKNFPQDKMPLSKWFTYRFRQELVNDGGNMKLEGWIDGRSFGSHTDKGEMTELNEKAKRKLQEVLDNKDRGALHGKMTNLRQVWTVGAYSGMYIRLTGTKKGNIRKITVKEI